MHAKPASYPIEREAMRQLYLQVASAHFDGAPELAKAAIRAIRAVKSGDVSNLDEQAAKVLAYAESNTIRIRPSDDDEALE